jgi:uncharacterized membrane protein (DUF4010 family)
LVLSIVKNILWIYGRSFSFGRGECPGIPADHSLVLLPLLPNKGYGPWEALNPYWTWWMVVLISGIYALSVVSGLIDVDAIALSLSRAARQHGCFYKYEF